jgi:hypothetical protein
MDLEERLIGIYEKLGCTNMGTQEPCGHDARDTSIGGLVGLVIKREYSLTSETWNDTCMRQDKQSLLL